MNLFSRLKSHSQNARTVTAASFLLIVPMLLIPGSASASQGLLPPGLIGPQLEKIQIPSFITDSVDREALLAEDAAIADATRGIGPLRFAVAQTVSLSAVTGGEWTEIAQGWELWRLEIRSPGSLSLSSRIENFDLPPGAQMWIYDADGAQVRGPFTAGDKDRMGGLSTPIILGENMVLELMVPPHQRGLTHLEITEIYRGYRFFGEKPGATKRGDCNINVVCPEGDAWRDQIRSVARITYPDGGYTWLCTGNLLNNTTEDDRPLFLTAGHCQITESNAHTMQVYWNYESPTCDNFYGGSLSQFQIGATLLAEWGDASDPGTSAYGYGGDVRLVELDDEPAEDFDVHFAGWDASTAIPQAVVGIHHPSGDQKSISFENDALTVTRLYDDRGENNWLKVNDWDLGTTEGGSSGSCIFDQTSGLCVGTLSGGAAACGNNWPDWYGWIHRQWEGGGAPDSRLKDWLDPLDLGVTSLQGRDPGGITPPQTVWLIPAAASTPGYGTSDWKTQIGVANPSNEIVTASLFFVESGEEWPGRQLPGSHAIPAGGALFLDDVLADDKPTTGLMYVSLDSDETVVSTRTYNLAEGDVTFGQGIPGIRLDQTTSATSLVLPLVHSVPGRFRTNLGLVQTSATNFRVQVTVHDPAGLEIATKAYRTTSAYTQVNNLLNDLGVGAVELEGGWIEVTLTVGSPAFWTTYASVVDEDSNDPTYVLPVGK
ncbi:MAG: hypothetical protein K8R59_07900 [Thermoanaerobaculales bacterium]|nr:hypothetical protein [Thermoanaerobaculales bacterium]